MQIQVRLWHYFSATKAQSHKEKPWCLSDFVATLKFLCIKFLDSLNMEIDFI